MYPHFIEVHQDGCQALLNIDHIVGFAPYTDSIMNTKFNALICNSNGEQAPVEETYEELKQLISDAGCHIQKADPRLDTTTPLTMADLKGMIGEPVWNSNSRTWFLVQGVNGDGEISMTDQFGYGHDAKDEDLISKPLYRMKRKTE